MPEPTDEELAARVQAGDTEAFGALIERYQAKLLRYGRKFLANSADIEDLVQDAFISAYQNIRGFDATKRFSPWIYRIAHNAFVDGLRKRSRNPVFAVDLDTLVPHLAYDDPAGDEREVRFMREAIERGLEKIPLKYREVLVLYYLEGLSYQDIAEVLHVPVGTVGIRLVRGRAALKKHVNPELLS